MQPSILCYSLLKHYEGLELEAYECSGGKMTIGYGNTYHPNGKPVRKGDKITIQQAEAYLPTIVQTFAISVNQALKVNVQQHQFDALVCLAYNIGVGNFEKSTVLKLINKGGSLADIEKWWLAWNKAKGVVLNGLVARRKSEFHLYKEATIKIFN